MPNYYTYNTNNGVIVADTSSVQADIQAMYRTVFGEGFSVDPSTPQGTLIAVDVLTLTTIVNNNVAIANQLNPNVAGGIFLDAIGALSALPRRLATQSFVSNVTLAGVPGTIIYNGAIAATDEEHLFELTSGDVTLGEDGIGHGDFMSVESGPIPAAANTLTTVVTDIEGWETVTNPNPAQLGLDNESDAGYRSLRNATLAWNGSMLAEAIIAVLLSVPGLTFVPSWIENITSSTEVIEGVTMNPNSIYLCIAGGSDFDIAEAIVSRKSGGCNYTNGASETPVAVDYTNPISGQVTTVKFDRPDLIQIVVEVTVRVKTAITNPQAAVTKAILDFASGAIAGNPGFAPGQDVSAFELCIAIADEVVELAVDLVQIKVAGGEFSTNVIHIERWEQAQVNAGSITVIVDGTLLNSLSARRIKKR